MKKATKIITTVVGMFMHHEFPLSLVTPGTTTPPCIGQLAT